MRFFQLAPGTRFRTMPVEVKGGEVWNEYTKYGRWSWGDTEQKAVRLHPLTPVEEMS